MLSWTVNDGLRRCLKEVFSGVLASDFVAELHTAVFIFL